ncbi:MAG: transaldolase, partial [Actinomycetota bacterium]|nr:transaldolase [Actinomycetota bacterium]
MSRLQRLFAEHGQSPWIDNLTRPMIAEGVLQALVDRGVRGVTSNPTIFQKAILAGSHYDEQFASLALSHSVPDTYWGLVIRDVTDALDVLGPLHHRSGGTDGFVSLEVSPAIAADAAATMAAARWLHDHIKRPNLLVKIPATAQGVTAIRQMVAEGRSINVTLIFGLSRYADVIDAYLSGLEDRVAASGEGTGTDLSGVHSVASFFVSRVDTEVDRRLEAVAAGAGPDTAVGAAALALRGKVAVAQAKAAYQLFLERFSGPRWEALEHLGAQVQRPLWASTSTKNPAYPELLYVDSLIGPSTVNTMPDATLEAFAEHGNLVRSLDAGTEAAYRTLDQLAEVGVDLEDVAAVLEQQGVASFLSSFDDLMAALTSKADAMKTHAHNAPSVGQQ